MGARKKKSTRDEVLRKGLRGLGLWRGRGRKVIKNRVQRGSRGVRKGPGLAPAVSRTFTAKTRSRSGCAGAPRRGISMAPPQSTQRTQRTEMSMPIAHSLYHSPPRCADGNWRRNGFWRNAVFEWEKRENFLNF